MSDLATTQFRDTDATTSRRGGIARRRQGEGPGVNPGLFRSILATTVMAAACGNSSEPIHQTPGGSGGTTSSVAPQAGEGPGAGGSTGAFVWSTATGGVSPEAVASVICSLSCDPCSLLTATSDLQLLTAEQVGAAVGSAVRFKGFDYQSGSIVAEDVASGQSLLITSGVLSQPTDGISYYRLPDSYADWHFVTRGYLACSSSECALFEVANATSEVLQPISGGTVPEAFIGDQLILYQHRLCVMNRSATAWCFDRETWTSIDAAPLRSLTGELLKPSQSGNICASLTDAAASLVRWELSDYSTARFYAATSDGQLARGDWQGTTSCCTYSEPLGAPLDLVLYSCGLAENALLLTETALYGTLSCPID